MQQKLKEHAEASEANPSIVVPPPSLPTRHEKWKRARQKTSGEYTSEPVRVIAEKIVSNNENLLVIVHCNYTNFEHINLCFVGFFGKRNLGRSICSCWTR